MGMNSDNYKNLYGWWKVTTEGDCEGKTMKRLGDYKGWLDEIALHLADKVGYCLCFSKIADKSRDDYVPKKKSVNVMLDIDSNTWDMTPDEIVKYMRRLFNDNGRIVHITNGNTYASFTIAADVETVADKRRKILERLSEEEIEILGIK